jgi:hypothetical protein
MTWFTSLRRDERGSLPMALMVVTVGLAMSATLTPVVVRQFEATKFLDARNTALNAAQTGMDVMMARVRAAANEKLEGLLESLPPCVLRGDQEVPGATEQLLYHVTVEYRDQDGVKLPDCPVNNVPTTALVTSIGYGDKNAGKCPSRPLPQNNRPCRTLTATYIFSTSNTNIPGGNIRIDSSSLSSPQCIDADTTAKTPAKGQRVRMKACSGGSTQQFGYTPDLYLKLIYSESLAAPYGMCLDVLPTHNPGGTNYLQFDFCPENRTSRFQWSLDGSSRFKSTRDNSGTPVVESNNCLSLDSPNTANSLLVIGNCTVTSSRNIWRSSTGVGAGMAGDSTAQLVNYEQFSRCLDVTNQAVTSGYMIAWFCKQDPGGVVDWNQRWVHPVPSLPETFKSGPILVTTGPGQTPPNTTFCLRSPLSAASNAYTTVVNCTSAAARTAHDVQWTVYHDTGIYASSYRIEDDAGFCLMPTSQKVTPKDAHGDGTSKVKVAVCNSSELQKWNAPPNINKPTPLTDLYEK